jgi:hypothetical protein
MTPIELHNAAVAHITDALAATWSPNKIYIGPSNAEYDRASLPITEIILDSAEVEEETFGQDLMTLSYFITGVWALTAGTNRDAWTLERSGELRAELLNNPPGTLVKVAVEAPVLVSGPDADARVRFQLSCGVER